MFPFWLILGFFLVLLGIFNRQMLRFLGIKPMSEVFTIPSLTNSSRVVEKLGRWLVILLGMSFLVQGLGSVLPNEISSRITAALLGLVGLMILAIIGITIFNWKIR